MQLTYWNYAFATVVYLINCLPTPTLQLCSPFARLFNTTPKYKKLCIFVYLCYPWLRHYFKHKLEPRSTPCLFLGYSTSQSAYLFLALNTSRLFVSRHVDFIKNSFPLSTRHYDLPRATAKTLSTWLPPVQPLSHMELGPTKPLALISTNAPLPSSSSSSTLPSSPDPPSSSLPPPPLAPSNTHTMLTSTKNNIHKFVSKLNLNTVLSSLASIEPSTVTQVLKHLTWHQALRDEFDALVRNGTWDLVPPDPLQNPVGYKWVFCIKCHPDGSVESYKARPVTKGFHQCWGINYHDTFNPVVKPTTIRLEFHPTPTGFHLTQNRYINDLLTRSKIIGAMPISTPLTYDNSLTLQFGTTLIDSFEYYTVPLLTTGRPQNASSATFVVHLTMVSFYASLSLSLHAFLDADWAGNKDDYTSTSAHIIYIGRHSISWSSKKQRTVACSSTKAEYCSVATIGSEVTWIFSLLTKLGFTLPASQVIYCDNIGATYLCSNPVFHSHMKQIALDYHFVRGKVQTGALRVTRVSSADQLADTLTKPLPRSHFHDFRIKIGISPVAHLDGAH